MTPEPLWRGLGGLVNSYWGVHQIRRLLELKRRYRETDPAQDGAEKYPANTKG